MGQLVRAIVVFATKQCLFRAVSTTRIEALREGWVEAQEGLRFAINFLKANAGIEDESLLSSPMFIHTLAAFSRVKDNKITKVEERALLQWLLVANARGRYSRGSTETLLNEDLNVIFRGADVGQLLEILKRQFGRLHVERAISPAVGGQPALRAELPRAQGCRRERLVQWLGLSLTHQGRLHFIQWPIFSPGAAQENGFETARSTKLPIWLSSPVRQSSAGPSLTLGLPAWIIAERGEQPSQRMRADGCQFLNG